MKTPTDNLKFQGSLSIFFSASIWGLFWIPLRYFDEAGVYSLWAVAYINFAASLIALPVAFFFGKFERSQLKWLRLLLGAGGWPLPQNIGDVFGILAGMFWALGLTMMRGQAELDALIVSASSLFFAFLMAIFLGLIMHSLVPNLQPAVPSFETAISIVLPVMAFGILILWTTMFGQLWGAKYVAATTAALLTMSEILAATISTALLDASNLPWISWVGAGLIMVAILIDLFAGNSEKA